MATNDELQHLNKEYWHRIFSLELERDRLRKELAEMTRSRDYWQEEARQFCQNARYWQDQNEKD